MLTNRNISHAILILNGLVILAALLYGIGGEGGGGSTEGVFILCAILDVADVCILIAITIMRPGWIGKNLFWLVAIILFLSPSSYIIASNWLSYRAHANNRKKNIQYMHHPSASVYSMIKNDLTKAYESDSAFIDTIFFAPDEKKIMAISMTKRVNIDLKDLYKNSFFYENQEIFGEKINNKWKYFLGFADDFTGYDTSYLDLEKSVMDYFLSSFSFYDNSDKSVWTDQYIWKDIKRNDLLPAPSVEPK
jgi:hypothetical protein